MNRMMKMGFAAVTLAVAVPAFAAAEVEEVDTGAIGWTPVAVGLASPVQLPWGHCVWDVRGLDLGVFYYGAPKMYGIGIAGLGELSTDTASGLEVAGLMNWNKKTAYGLRVTAGANVSTDESDFNGVDIGGFAYRRDMWGVDVQWLAAWQKNNNGVEISGLFNYTDERSYGFQAAAGANIAETVFGCQLAIFNWANELHGAQLGVVNFCDNCEWGFQVGLVNIILSNRLKVLPIVNAYF